MTREGPRPDLAYPDLRRRGGVEFDPSVPLGVRKQMLVMRSTLQREELAQGLRAVRRSSATVRGGGLSWLNIDRMLSLWKLSGSHPSVGSALGSMLSFGLSRWRWPTMRYVGLALSAAWLGWQAWDLLQQARRHAAQGRTQRPRPSAGTQAQRPAARPQHRSYGEDPGLSADLALLRRMQDLARQIDEGR